MDWNRRTLLKIAGAALPALNLVRELGGQAKSTAGTEKFSPVDLSNYFHASAIEIGPPGRVQELVRLPAGAQELRGIPFQLGPQGEDRKSFLVLSTKSHPWTSASVEIPFGQKARHLCLAQFCNWDPNEVHPANIGVIERVGQHLADIALVFQDGSEKVFPIRRRFEVNAPVISWGHESFAALPHRVSLPTELTESLPNATAWGKLQASETERSNSDPLLWICALANPAPEQTIRAVRFQSKSDDLLAICGMTAFQGRDNPLRYERLTLFRTTLPSPVGHSSQWSATVDLGVVARIYTLADFQSEAWLTSSRAGLGEVAKAATGDHARHLYVEVTAAPDATLNLRNQMSGDVYRYNLRDALPDGESVRPGGPRVEILEKEKAWLHGAVVDPATQRPTPVRLAFRSKEGRYIPPYGHRREINDAWFQDYGADVKVMSSSFAYVDGTFQVELPVGEVYVEISKGFEYHPVRKVIRIEPGQRELRLEIPRLEGFQSKGWATSDTHVHFLSPSTAVLEGQAEGLNLINLLAAQWGDLFTNVGDISHGQLSSRDGQMIVSIGTENRQHLLGHIGLLGGHGASVFPMSADGPAEAYIGEPLWNDIADWADACRTREGLAVAVHFPYPTGEIAADIVLGKIDAVELYPRNGVFDSLRFNEWYRYLNCGYRLPAVGGTDKMGANMPVGANRTYAWLGQNEFNPANWANAVRSGNTFMSTGPLLLFQADQRSPGDEITLRAGGAAVEVRAEATSYVPIHKVEIVFNGEVIASKEETRGAGRIVLSEKVRVPGPGWLAARCSSRLEPTTSWAMAIAAHTSPIYLQVPGQQLFSPPMAAYMLSLIDGAETWVRSLAIRPDQKRLESVLKLYSDARERLHRRMHEQA